MSAQVPQLKNSASAGLPHTRRLNRCHSRSLRTTSRFRMSVLTFYGSVTCVPPVQTDGQLSRPIALALGRLSVRVRPRLARPFNPHMVWSVKRLGN